MRFLRKITLKRSLLAITREKMPQKMASKYRKILAEISKGEFICSETADGGFMVTTLLKFSPSWILIRIDFSSKQMVLIFCNFLTLFCTTKVKVSYITQAFANDRYFLSSFPITQKLPY